jgi:CRISPR-associated protein Cas2
MNVVISYDIRDKRRIRKVAKYLEGVGVRVQYSVFLFVDVDNKRLKKIVREVLRMIESEDSIKVYKLDLRYVIANYDISEFIV